MRCGIMSERLTDRDITGGGCKIYIKALPGGK
jgi:hypothetical protein